MRTPRAKGFERQRLSTRLSCTAERPDEPVALAVLGHVAEAEVEQRAPGRRLGDVDAVEADRSRRSARRSPVMACTSSVWPLPSTPATARISPARTSRLDAVDDGMVAVVEHGEVVDVEHDVAAGVGRAPCRRRA